jgi:hypothetical protein
MNCNNNYSSSRGSLVLTSRQMSCGVGSAAYCSQVVSVPTGQGSLKRRRLATAKDTSYT